MTDTLSLEALTAPIVSLIAVAAISAIIWNMSRRFTTIEVSLQNVKDELHITTKGLAEEISRQKIERQEDIGKALIAEKEELNTIQKQIDMAKGDIKGLLSKIEVNDTRINHSDEVHTDLKGSINGVRQDVEKRIQEHVEFFSKWNQRIEDRIEDLRKQLIQMYQRENHDSSK
jgi:predicted  nucleic acid-binding Zn-ribbon protein